MNEQEVRAVLATAMAYDNRKPGEANIAAWMEAASRGRWTFEAALEAVHQHYATSTQFLMPGHITAVVRARMQLPAPASEAVAEIEAAAPASEEVRRRFAALIGQTFKLPRGVKRAGRRHARRSAEDMAAREAARRELDAKRREQGP
jgi:hypothetical protein